MYCTEHEFCLLSQERDQSSGSAAAVQRGRQNLRRLQDGPNQPSFLTCLEGIFIKIEAYL